jgi:hypothetical protein
MVPAMFSMYCRLSPAPKPRAQSILSMPTPLLEANTDKPIVQAGQEHAA